MNEYMKSANQKVVYSVRLHQQHISLLYETQQKYFLAKNDCINTFIQQFTVPLINLKHSVQENIVSKARPVNRPPNHQYKYISNKFNHIQRIIELVEAFSADISGDIYFQRCNALLFSMDSDTMGKFIIMKFEVIVVCIYLLHKGNLLLIKRQLDELNMNIYVLAQINQYMIRKPPTTVEVEPSTTDNLASKLHVSLKNIPRNGLNNIQWKQFEKEASNGSISLEAASTNALFANNQSEYFHRLTMFMKDIDETLLNYPYFALF